MKRYGLKIIVAAAGLAISAVAQDTAAQTRTVLDVKADGQKTFYVNDRVGNNQITFFSESTLEDFTGVCNRIGGQFTINPRHVESLTGRFSLRVENMKTGIDLRDRHLRSADWLDAGTHPEIVIEITGVEDVKKAAGDTAKMTLVGKCSLHGKTRDVRLAATLKYLDESPKTQRRAKGDLILLRSKFGVKLSDYGIGGPQGSDVIGLKVSNEIEVRVTVFGSTERPPDDLKADDASGTPARRPPPRKKDG